MEVNNPTTTESPSKTPEEQATPILCTHCELPVPKGLIELDAEHQFCCNGCKTVYEMIHACGLDPYYALRQRADAQPTQAKTTDKKYTEYDNEKFVDLYTHPLSDSRRAIDLVLEGVHCAACVWLVEKLPQILPGVLEARLNFSKALLRIVWEPGQVPLSKIARLLDSLGYPPHPAQSSDASLIQTRADRKFIIRIGAAAVCAGNNMLIAFALYAGMFSWMEDEYRTLFRFLSMFFGLIALAWPGQIFLRGAYAAIRTRTPHLDLPIAVALIAGTIAGIVHTLTGSGEIYFDSLAVLILLLLVGRWVQHRQQRRADDAVQLLFSLTPRTARLLDSSHVQDLNSQEDDANRGGIEVPIESIKTDDLIEVRAGDTFPVDGIITYGSSAVSQAILTGESKPIPVQTNDKVLAASLNLSSTLHVRVKQTGSSTRIGKLMQFVEQYAQQKSPSIQLADQIAGIFVITVIVAASLTWLAWLYLNPATATEHAIALLIVACPCALGLATPLTIAAGIGRAANMNILIKGGAALENLSTTKNVENQCSSKPTIFLDKTGTLTRGQTTLRHFHAPDSLKPAVFLTEQSSSHHIARALVDAFSVDTNIINAANDLIITDMAQHPDGGIEAIIDHQRLTIGSPSFFNAHNINITSEHQSIIDQSAADGLTPVVLAYSHDKNQSDESIGVCTFGDALRDDAISSIASIQRLGWNVVILSGDDPAVVNDIAAKLNIPHNQARGGLTPEDKLNIIKQHQSDTSAPAIMIGDGINDAAALAAADVGIAVHGGAEASLSAADIYLAQPGLSSVLTTLALAKRTRRIIRQNLFISLSYNLIGVILAALGIINPLIAAVLMPISSFTVITLAVGGNYASLKKSIQQLDLQLNTKD
ncbi:heavy metal translocating P-type ATPase [Poriferisphaera sp. WC338]|uniref:heavy metal translocating P-type ATPase n=1 Tax=Poriferisphaera sp. WC338 TaxID=3425129 RepID=UPI003D8196B5